VTAADKALLVTMEETIRVGIPFFFVFDAEHHPERSYYVRKKTGFDFTASDFIVDDEDISADERFSTPISLVEERG
jgi:hypothetical protein